MKLDGKVAIVTGAAHGLGRAIAFGLAKENADLFLADLDIEAVSEVADQVKKLGRKAIVTRVDVAKTGDAARMAEEALAQFGKIDILINNAGGTARERRSLFHVSTEEVWDYVISLNLKGVLNCTRSVINHMMERRSGKVVSIASASGVVGSATMVDYSAAKAGVIGFTMALAKEVVSYGINVNCVSPGPMQTRALNSATTLEAMKKSTGFGRVGQPEEIASMVVFLASDEASYITGQNMLVCGLTNIGTT
jgi:NAD(P)-dependent dehydrogenase (short-subunit alcohol dehydrogenase family)